jgi:hypothetical protein
MRVLRHDWNISYHYPGNSPPSENVNRTADLDAALGFVIGRIEEEATRSGESLSDEQRFLLNHLPKVSALPEAYGLTRNLRWCSFPATLNTRGSLG